jgi:anti-anti-sigma factor
VEVDERTELLVCSGELDLSSAEQLRGAVAGATRRRLIVDLGALDFIDSTGVGMLLEAARSRDPGCFVLCMADRGAVARVFQVLGLRDSLPISATVEQATRALAYP